MKKYADSRIFVKKNNKYIIIKNVRCSFYGFKT